MAAKNKYEVASLGPNLILVAGSFAMNAGSNPDAASRAGRGFSVVWTAAGRLTVTLGSGSSPLGLFPTTDRYFQLVSASALVELAAGDTGVDLYPQLRNVNLTNGTFEIALKTAAVDTNPPAAAAGRRIHFMLLLSNTSAVPTRG